MSRASRTTNPVRVHPLIHAVDEKPVWPEEMDFSDVVEHLDGPLGTRGPRRLTVLRSLGPGADPPTSS